AARQAPAAATGRLVCELKAERHDEGEDTFEERLAIAKELEVRRFAPEIDSDGAGFSRRFRRCAHGYPSVIRSRKLRRHSGGNVLKSQDHCEGLRVLPRNTMECEICDKTLMLPRSTTTHENRIYKATLITSV